MTNRPLLLSLSFAVGLAACDPAPEDMADDAASEQPAPPAMQATVTETGALVNPNDADRATLMALPGLDSAAVAVLMANRPFPDMVALNARLAERMDSTALDALYRRMWIPLDLDTATREEILLIPGVGPRMAHEFEEYRPYDGGIAEFRREIGKYVDDAEVARLERYVTVR